MFLRLTKVQHCGRFIQSSSILELLTAKSRCFDNANLAQSGIQIPPLIRPLGNNKMFC
jgi:hypothetical protein